MNRKTHYIRAGLLGTLTAALIVACGGSGGDSSTPPPPNGGPPPPPTPPGQVTTTEGIYQGSIEGSLAVFRGIRYAAAPVGDLRFNAPQTPPQFSGVQDADAFGPACSQPSSTGAVGEEDCLFLNIWAHNDDVVRPVVVYLHPGGSNGISGALESIDGAVLAENNDVIVVNFNRRLGALGYLALDELVMENPLSTAGNYAILDIIAALEWVEDNIAAFNGDPNRVLVSGTSAGGIALCSVIAAPAAMGLFDAIAIQSAACSGRLRLSDQIPFPSRFPPALVDHRNILTETGCDVAADPLVCLRGLSAGEIIDAGERASDVVGYDAFRAVIDGVVIQSDPFSALENGVSGDVPLIAGGAQDEADFLFPGLVLADDAAYRDFLAVVFPQAIADQLYAIYPSSNFASPTEAFLTLMGDRIFNCGMEELVRSAAAGVPSYLYEITRGPEPGQPAGHAIDIPFLFDTYDVFGQTPDAQGFDIGLAIQGAWSSLAADQTAAPTYLPQGSSSWPAYDANNNNYVDFGDTIEATNGHRGDRCLQLGTVISF